MITQDHIRRHHQQRMDGAVLDSAEHGADPRLAAGGRETLVHAAGIVHPRRLLGQVVGRIGNRRASMSQAVVVNQVEQRRVDRCLAADIYLPTTKSCTRSAVQLLGGLPPSTSHSPRPSRYRSSSTAWVAGKPIVVGCVPSTDPHSGPLPAGLTSDRNNLLPGNSAGLTVCTTAGVEGRLVGGLVGGRLVAAASDLSAGANLVALDAGEDKPHARPAIDNSAGRSSHRGRPHQPCLRPYLQTVHTGRVTTIQDLRRWKPFSCRL